MSQTNLEGADLTSSNIDGLKINQDALKGMVVEPLQAAYLASLFGLNVQWT